jgi:hypothetical protein
VSDRERRFEREPVERDRVGRDLEELGYWIDYPVTPDLARATRQRLEEIEEDADERSTAQGRFRMPLSPRWAVAAVSFVLVVSLPLFSQDTRETLSGVFMSGGSAGSAASGGAESEESGGTAGGSAASDAPSARQGGVTVSGSSSGADEAVTGAGKEFGSALTLEQARERLDGRLPLPHGRALSDPEEIYALGRSSGRGQSNGRSNGQRSGVAIVYLQSSDMPSLGGTGAGLVLIEIPGEIRSMYPARDLAQSSGAEELKVGGGRGYWVTGREKLPPPLDLSIHPPANVLIWERGGLVLRLETELPRGEAIRLAESVR